MRRDTPQGVANVGEFAIVLPKDTVAPAMKLEMRKAINKRLRRFVRLNWQKHVDSEARHKPLG
jgi:hypothetical protein